jgi:glycosyltransferase involved in cell wall biosynthesis
MPAISIVVSAYNVSWYIEGVLESLLGQTLKDIEVICVDDASTDGTEELVKKMASADSRLAYVRNDRNLGLFATRQVGTDRTTGAYVMYVEGEDELEPDACERLLAEMGQGEVDILHFGVRVDAEPWCSREAVGEIAATMNPPTTRTLTGNSILTQCFLEQSYDCSVKHKLFRGDLVRDVMKRLGEMPGVSATGSAIEFFALALAAGTYRAIASSPYYILHLGRCQGRGGGVTLESFMQSVAQECECRDSLSAHLAQEDFGPLAEIQKCLVSAFGHELSHVMSVWQHGLALPDRVEALATVRDTWGEHPVATELYRLLRDDACALSQGELPSDGKRAVLDRFETNKACLEELLPEAQLWDDDAALVSMRERARSRYEGLLDVVAMDHESSDGDAAWIMSEVGGRCSRLDHILEKKRPDETFAALFRRIFTDGRFEAISTLQGAERLRVTRRKVRTVGLYYFRLAGGGAEKVTRSLAAMFLSEGYRVVLLCDVLPPQGCIPRGAALVRLPDLRDTNPGNYLRRGRALEEALQRHEVDLLVCSQWQSHCLEWDQFVTKALGIAFVVHTHGSCTHVIAHDSEDDYALPIAYRLSDAVVCLDDMDRAFWSQFNARSFTTVNRSSFSTSEVAAAPLASHKIIWVGRMSMDEKRPMDAIEILSRVRLSVPDARLEMVGPGEPGVFERLRSRARELGVDDAVSFLGPRDDVSSLMSGASVHLLTSPSEGFSLVVLESKTCGVPCVMYQLPIRFSREGKGVANVRQGDLDGAAAAIVRLLQDDDLRHRMGVEARERQGDRDV